MTKAGAGRIAISLLGLLALSGCQCPDRVPPRTAREAMERINANVDKVRAAVYAPARVSARFNDENGRERRFLAQPATLIFDPPRCLMFEIRNELAGPVARVGSNEEEYWVWVDSGDLRKLWYGSWDAYQRGAAKQTILDPDGLLDVLMMRPLPESGPSGERPILRPKGNTHELVFYATDRERWPYEERVYLLDACPPYQPKEIVQNLPDGSEYMHAYLTGYGKIEDDQDAAYIPRNLVVYWKQLGSELRLDFSSVKYRTKSTPFCDFPERWDGEVEALDLGAPPRVPRATKRSTATQPSATRPTSRPATQPGPRGGNQPPNRGATPPGREPIAPAGRNDASPGRAPTRPVDSRPSASQPLRPTQTQPARPAATQPAGGAGNRPAAGGPATRPANQPASQPASRPSGPVTPPRGRGPAAS